MSLKFNELISPRLLNEQVLKQLNARFLAAKPFQHLQIKNFLLPNIANSLLKEIKKEIFFEKESDLFSFRQTHDLHFSKSKILKNFNTSLLSWNFFNFISKLANQKFSGVLDMSATLYGSSSFLLCHDDKLDGRKIAYLIYLSKDFAKSDGGSFVLYNSKKYRPTTPAKSYLPEWNSLLIFKVSKISFHEVEENYSKKPRYAIGGWLK